MQTNNRILVVDDNQAIHNDFNKILRGRGPELERQADLSDVEALLFAEPERPRLEHQPASYALDFALQASEAFDMIDEAEEGAQPYAILFTDVRMPPGFDGIWLVDKVLQRAPFTEIVIITAFADYTWEDLNQRFGWTDRILILRKPFDSITIKQIASTLTKKWELGYQTRSLTKQMSLHMQDLERTVAKRTADLNAAYEELRELAYIVSHDLRTPLVGIQGFTRELGLDIADIFALVEPLLPSLDEQSGKQLDAIRRERIPEALEMMRASAVRMDRQVQAVLTLAKMGYRRFEPEDLSLEELVEAQLQSLAFAIAKQGVTIEVAALPRVLADPLAIEQILANLIANAVKYLDPDRPGHIAIGGERKDNEVQVHITDNGRGIPEQHQARIFRIFQRVAHPGTEGMGMGLTYVRTLLQRMGGDIWCDSRVGIGTTFGFRIPDQTENDRAAEPELPWGLIDS